MPLVTPVIRAAGVSPTGELWISLGVPFTYVYNTDGDKVRTVQFTGAGPISPTSLFFSRSGKLLVTPGLLRVRSEVGRRQKRYGSGHSQTFDTPDETRVLVKGTFELIHVGGMTIGRATYEPGWKWSEHVGPVGRRDPLHGGARRSRAVRRGDRGV